MRADEARLTADIIALACQYGRYGYRRVTELLRRSGGLVNDKRVNRTWRREGLKVPRKQHKYKRLWSNDGSCIRLRAARPNHVWSHDFIENRTNDSRKIRMLNVVDEFTRECLATRMDRRRHSTSVIDVLSDLFFLRGVPGHVRADNGPKLIAKAMQAWIRAVSAKTAFITPGSPWKNGYIESFNARMRNELINSKLFYSLNKTSIVIGNGQHYYDSIRPHSSIEYKAPATEMFVLAAQRDRLGPMGRLRQPRWI